MNDDAQTRAPSDAEILTVVLLSRSEGPVALAGRGRRGAGFADGFAAAVHASLPQEAPLPGPGGAGGEGPALPEGEELRHRG